MTTKSEKIAQDILRELKAHGFSRLRATEHGTVYGLDKFRMSLPNNFKDWGRNSDGNSLRKRWEEVKSEAYGELPGLKDKVQGRSPTEPQQELHVIQTLEVPTTTEEQPQTEVPANMPTRPKKFQYKYLWTCPSCKQVYKHPGRHKLSCKGTPSAPKSKADNSLDDLLTRLKGIFNKLTAERDEALKKVSDLRKHLQ